MKKIAVLMLIIILMSGCTNRQKTLTNNEQEQKSCNCPSCKEECRKQCDEEITEAKKRYKHEIDLAEEKCLKNAYSNADMMKCADIAIDSWLIEIDKNMSILKRILPSEKYALILNSQKEWERYKKAEFKAESTLIFHKGGTFYYTVSLGAATGLVRERALELRRYINLYSEKY